MILTLTTVAPYELGAPSTATVTITDTAAPLVSVTAFDSAASEAPGDVGTFRFARTGSTAAPLTVTFTVDRHRGRRYRLHGVAGVGDVCGGRLDGRSDLMPVADGDAEAPETVILTVSDGATYDVGAPRTATVTITG